MSLEGTFTVFIELRNAGRFIADLKLQWLLDTHWEVEFYIRTAH